jgi:hypothetical protein
MKKLDEQLLVMMARVTHRRRAVLCALAQRGKALRQEQPARAQRLLELACGHPLYKSGRLVFDMAEVAEAMREGPPPHALEDEVLGRLIRPVLSSVMRNAAGILAASPVELGDGTAEPVPGAWSPRSIWPPLSPADPLYDLIVLGVVGELLKQLPPPGTAALQRPRMMPSV